jgi:hypothetical protein
MSEQREQNDFEAMLRKALRPVQPPETLARFLAVAAEAEEQERRTGRRWFRPASGGLLFVMPWPRAFAGGALAGLLLLGGLLGEQQHRRHERAAAEQEFATSMRITEQTMERTRAQLLQAGIQLDQ